MLTNSYNQIDETQHPIDMVEELATLNSWDFNRITDDKIVMNVEALWRNYVLTLAISEEDKILKLVCSFEIKASKNSLSKIYETLNIIKIAAKNSNIVGADLNELSPIKGFNSYNFLVAKLAYKILSYKFLY